LRQLAHLEAPATLDGGDVLRLGKQLFVGLSARTNQAGVAQLARHLEPHGYVVHGVALGACLHLKTAVTEAAWSETDGSTILVNPAWFDPRLLGDVTVIEVDPSEPFAANCLRVDDRVIYPAAFPRTRERLEAHGIEVIPVEVDELAKAEGAVTCCSILVR
jgi:dimethylargininase